MIVQYKVIMAGRTVISCEIMRKHVLSMYVGGTHWHVGSVPSVGMVLQ